MRQSRRSDKIVRHVSERIQSGDLVIGDRLPSERDLAEKLGVSRPQIREGYRVLESLGIIEVRHGSGVYVADRHAFAPHPHPAWSLPVSGLDAVAFADVMAERTAQLAATNASDEQLQQMQALYDQQKAATESYDLSRLAMIDSQFHSLVAHASGNAIAIIFTDQVMPYLQRERNVVLGTTAHQSLTEHGQVLEALLERDAIRAGAAHRLHLLRSLRVYRDLAMSSAEDERSTGPSDQEEAPESND